MNFKSSNRDAMNLQLGYINDRIRALEQQLFQLRQRIKGLQRRLERLHLTGHRHYRVRLLEDLQSKSPSSHLGADVEVVSRFSEVYEDEVEMLDYLDVGTAANWPQDQAAWAIWMDDNKIRELQLLEVPYS